MLISGPRAKFGRNVITMGRRNHIKFALKLASGLCYILIVQFRMCLKHQYFVVPDSVFKQKYGLFRYEKVKYYAAYQWHLIFQ